MAIYLKGLGRRTLISGILNLTADSFSGDGLLTPSRRKNGVSRIVQRMAACGADIIDVGGESSRPGAGRVSPDEELRRVLPTLQRLVRTCALPISIDTYKYEVARCALELGATIVNDITGLRGDARMAELVARHKAYVVIMHMKGEPRTMQVRPYYKDLILEIKSFFKGRMKVAIRAGIKRDRIILDPGIGFGKKLEHNLMLLRSLGEFKSMGYPVLVGPSRKSFIGEILDRPVDERVWGTASAVSAAIFGGADIVRVHDVCEMAQVVRMTDAIFRIT